MERDEAEPKEFGKVIVLLPLIHQGSGGKHTQNGCRSTSFGGEGVFFVVASQ